MLSPCIVFFLPQVLASIQFDHNFLHTQVKDRFPHPQIIPCEELITKLNAGKECPAKTV